MYILSSHTAGNRVQGKSEKDWIQYSRQCLIKWQAGSGEPNPDSTFQLCDLFVPRFPFLPSVFARAVPSLCNTLPPFCTVVPPGLCFDVNLLREAMCVHCLFPRCMGHQLLFCLFLLFSICFSLCKFSWWLWPSFPIYLLIFLISGLYFVAALRLQKNWVALSTCHIHHYADSSPIPLVLTSCTKVVHL